MDHVGIMEHIGIGCAITPESSQEVQGISSTNQIRVNPWQKRGEFGKGILPWLLSNGFITYVSGHLI